MNAFVLALALALTPAGGQGLVKPTPVRAQGCVQAGVEARCLMVKDLRSGILYSLFVKDAQPKVGEGIDFAGAPHDGPAYCMQGVALDVIRWARNDAIQCTPSKPAKP